MRAERLLSTQVAVIMSEHKPEVCLQDPALLRLAAHQAARDEEVQAARRLVAELEAELGDAQRTLDLQNEQSAALKEVGGTWAVSLAAAQAPEQAAACTRQLCWKHAATSQQLLHALPGS